MSTSMIPAAPGLEEQAKMIVASQCFPNVKSVAAAMTIMLKGMELGVPPVSALQEIYLIQGQVACSTKLKLALAARSGVIRWGIVSEDKDHCSYKVARYTDPSCRQLVTEYTATFTKDDAKAAGLADKPIWKQYSGTMMRRRAASLALDEVVPDLMRGMYSFADMGVVCTENDNDWSDERPILAEDGELIVEGGSFVATNEDANAYVEAVVTATAEEQAKFKDDMKSLAKDNSMGKTDLFALMNSLMPEGRAMEDLSKEELNKLYYDTAMAIKKTQE